MQPVAPRENPIQSCFAYFAETVDECIQSDVGFFLREGDIYIAVRPLAEGARWARSKMAGFDRIDMPGAVTGCVVEIGDKAEYGSFASFQKRVAGAHLDTSELTAVKRVSYVSTRGHKLDIRCNDDGCRSGLKVGPSWLSVAPVHRRPLLCPPTASCRHIFWKSESRTLCRGPDKDDRYVGFVWRTHLHSRTANAPSRLPDLGRESGARLGSGLASSSRRAASPRVTI